MKSARFALLLTTVSILLAALLLGCGGGGGGQPGSAIYFMMGDVLHIARDMSLAGEQTVTIGDGIIAVDSKGRLYRAAGLFVARYDNPALGQVSAVFPRAGTDPAKVFGTQYIGQVTVDSSDRIYVSGDRGVTRMDDMDGNGWKQFQYPKNDPPEFIGGGHRTVGGGFIFVDVTGRIWASGGDRTNSAIFRFNDMDGNGCVQVGGTSKWFTYSTWNPLPNGEQFGDAQGISVDIAGHLFVADAKNLRIVYMEDVNGTGFKTLNTVGTCGLQWTRDIAQDNQGRLYFTDANAHRLYRVGGIFGTGWAVTAPQYNGGLNGPLSIWVVGSPSVTSGNSDLSCGPGSVGSKYVFKDLHPDIESLMHGRSRASRGRSTSQSRGVAVNSSGLVAGNYVGATQRGYTWLNGAVTDLGLGTVYAMSDSGTIVGTTPVSGVDTAATFSNSGPSTLVGAGTLGSTAYGVNSAGQIAGYITKTVSGASGPQTVQHAVLWSGGLPTDISTALPKRLSWATGVNTSGVVVGYMRDIGQADAAAVPFIWTPSSPNGTTGTAVALPVGTFAGGSANGITDSGEAYGAVWDSSGVSRNGAAVWRNGHLVILPSGPTGNITRVLGSNSLNYKVGEADGPALWKPDDTWVDLTDGITGIDLGLGPAIASGVSSDGKVTGSYYGRGQGNVHAWLLSPGP